MKTYSKEFIEAVKNSQSDTTGTGLYFGKDLGLSCCSIQELDEAFERNTENDNKIYLVSSYDFKTDSIKEEVSQTELSYNEAVDFLQSTCLL